MRTVFGFTALVFLLLGSARAATAFHPQDGPHADLRVSVESDGVRFSIGVNLAFLDEALDTPREAFDALARVEAEALLDDLRAYLQNEVVVEINGERIAPVIEQLDIFNDPDPTLLPLFPTTGMRALIRAVAILEYPSETPPESMAITWPTYPPDNLARQMEPGLEVVPPMYFEAQLAAEGRRGVLFFSEATPTATWTATGDTESDVLAGLPEIPVGEPPSRVSLVLLGLVAVYVPLVLIAVAAAKKGEGQRARLAIVGSFFVLPLAVFGRDLARVEIPGTGSPPPEISPELAQQVFRPLHDNLYHAFDYTEEEAVYDALARSVDGELLPTLYGEVFDQLLQAEEEGKLGVVTGLEPQGFELLRLAEDNQLGFTARHRWQVEGTVYHWGHSHTRLHEYEAEYDVSAIETDEGPAWRITDQRIISQNRLDVPQMTEQERREELLRSYGTSF
ncbi:MAG: hypothetical protein AAGI17_07940 [Planctomycetota bacterium]